jgi:hypothetical protein
MWKVIENVVEQGTSWQQVRVTYLGKEGTFMETSFKHVHDTFVTTERTCWRRFVEQSWWDWCAYSPLQNLFCTQNFPHIFSGYGRIYENGSFPPLVSSSNFHPLV